MYWIKRKIRQIRKVIKYVPIIWNSFDFDYRYPIDIFKTQLEDLATFLESDRACTLNAKEKASRIRTATRLMTKVYDEDYGNEYQKVAEAKYGECEITFDKDPDSEYFIMGVSYDGKPETEEMKEFISKQMDISNLKQEKAHRILWNFIAHNIRG